MQLQFFNFRFADEILKNPQYSIERQEILYILKNTSVPKLRKPKIRKRGKTERIFTTDQTELNRLLKIEFGSRGWDVAPLITENAKTRLQADFRKTRIQVEVQFGNMARWYTDVFKMMVSYSLDLIDVGVMVVPTQAFGNTIDENIAYFERIVRELPYAKMSLTLPILVIGIEP